MKLDQVNASNSLHQLLVVTDQAQSYVWVKKYMRHQCVMKLCKRHYLSGCLRGLLEASACHQNLQVSSAAKLPQRLCTSVAVALHLSSPQAGPKHYSST